MKKRLRKKKQGCYFKKIDVEITSIESLEKDFNYIVTFNAIDIINLIKHIY